MSVKLIGYDDTIRKLKALGPALGGKALKEGVLAAAQPIAEDASNAAPRGRTGRLQANIKARVKKSGKGRVVVEIGPTSKAFYGGFVELGTRKMPARPFLRPAFDKHVGNDGALREINRHLLAALKRLAR